MPAGPAVVAPDAGRARVLPPRLPEATGPWLRVDTMSTSLRMRSAPEISSPVTKNVVAELPDGWPVEHRRLDEILHSSVLGG